MSSQETVGGKDAASPRRNLERSGHLYFTQTLPRATRFDAYEILRYPEQRETLRITQVIHESMFHGSGTDEDEGNQMKYSLLGAGNRLLRLVIGASVALSLSATSLHAQDAPHGDHNPHHGGVVLMYGLDLHYEVVLTSAGNVQLWLSNAVREDLPASVVSDVAAEIEHAGTRQNIDMAISDSGDAWVGKTTAVKAEGTTLHLGFVYRGEPAALSFPATSLLGEGREKLVNDTAHAPTSPPDSDGGQR